MVGAFAAGTKAATGKYPFAVNLPTFADTQVVGGFVTVALFPVDWPMTAPSVVLSYTWRSGVLCAAQAALAVGIVALLHAGLYLGYVATKCLG